MIAFSGRLDVVYERMMVDGMSLDFYPKQVEEWYCYLLIWAKVWRTRYDEGKQVSVLEHVKFEMCLWTSKGIIELGSWLYKSDV